MRGVFHCLKIPARAKGDLKFPPACPSHLATASAGTLYAPPASAGPYTIMAQQAIVPTGGSQPHANIMPTLVGIHALGVR